MTTDGIWALEPSARRRLEPSARRRLEQFRDCFKKTPGDQRQSCKESGKIDNCVVANT